MHACSVLALLASCTFGAAARVEGTIDTSGKLRGAAELDGDVGITTFGNGTAEDVGHQRQIVAMMAFGVGWGPEGPRLSMGLGVLTIPSPSQRAGLVAGFHLGMDEHCTQFAWGVGPTMLLAQTRAIDRVDSFGPNPQLTRWYHAASAFAGWSECPASRASGARFGLAYEAGMAALEFAPGP